MPRILISLFFLWITSPSKGQALLSLKEALAIGLENNLEVKVSKTELEMAKESNTYGNAGFLPNVNFTSGRAFQWNDIQQRFANGLVVDRPGVATNQFNAGLGVNWVLYDGGQMFVVKKRQEAVVSAADLRLQNQILTLTDSISSAYYQLVLAGLEIQLSKEEETRTAERLKLSTDQFRLGLRSKSDLLLAQIDLNQIQNRIRNQETQMQIRKGSFNLILGREPDLDFSVESNPPDVNPSDFQNIKSRVLGQNLQIKFQKQNLEISKLDLKQIKSRALPQISLNSAYNFAQTRNQAGFALFNRSFGPNVGLTFNMPLFQGVSVSKLLKIGNMDLSVRALQLKSIENRIIGQIWRLVKNLEIQLQTIETERKNEALALENLEIVKGRFQMGQSTSLEMKDAEFQVNAAKSRLLQAKYFAKINEIQLLRLAGELKTN